MKKIGIIATLLVVGIGIANADQIDLSEIQKSHPKEMYSDSNGRVYTPYGEFFVHVSLTPKGKKLPLPNAASQELSKQIPIKLGLPGVHSIRHPYEKDSLAHADGNIKEKDKSRFMNITWDAKPPRVKLFEVNTNQVIDTGHLYFPLSSKFIVKSLDRYSGVNTTYLLINDKKSTLKGIKNSIDFNKEGRYDIKLASVDNVGNISQLATKSITIDATSPATSTINSGFIKNDNELIFGKSGKLSLKSIDNLSGVKDIYFQIDNGKIYTYKKPLRAFKLDTGNHSVNYYAIDKVGNVESKKSIKFYTDTKAPKTSLELVGDSYITKKYTFVSSRTKIKLDAEDYSGIKAIKYTLDGEEYGEFNRNFSLAPTFAKRVVFSPNNYTQEIIYYGIDSLNNIGKKQYKYLVVDRYIDKPKISFIGKHIFEDDINFITKATKIKLSAIDRLSGVQSIHYKYNSTNAQYKKLFSIDSILNTEFILSALANDNVNNSSKSSKATILVDSKAPKIFSHFSLFGLKAKSVKLKNDNKQIDTYTNKTKLFIGAADDAVGTDKIYYRLNNGKWRKYSNPIALKKAGNYNVDIKAVDRLGNRSTFTYKVRIVSYRDKRIIPDDSIKINYGG